MVCQPASDLKETIITAGEKTLQVLYASMVMTQQKYCIKVRKAIYESFKDELSIVPSSPDQWQRVSSDFSQRWNFHHCCGALDGKHIEIKKQIRAAATTLNTKATSP
ncbi:uncharacterized protein LOC105446899 [Strongylocentrotus purpuratus]|uniref:Uncharacterized protein n=1 Tax=Strongylocentrotus purpuratus TaxID=7668 RepID=A0A7M7HQ16_STRPU|nr:uncharacterized protein LOC105446899 [Strongylocentrotus purpuratus]|eukprot:XP_011682609.1 PREDICTED: uncharacterized protein LOC105446899 [Strongylocentrotus purpuratus]